MKKDIFAIIAIFLFSMTSVMAADYKSVKPHDLAMKSWDTPSVSEKVFIRFHLSKKYSNTPSGLWARAWIAGHERNSKKAKRLYLQCMKKYPDYSLCAYSALNITSLVESNTDVLIKAEKTLSMDPGFSHYRFLAKIYFIAIKNKHQVWAEAFLSRWKSKHPNAPVFDYIQGRTTSDFKEKDKMFLSAANKGDKNYDVYKYLIKNRFSNLKYFVGKGDDVEKLFAPLERYIKISANQSQVSKAYKLKGDVLKKYAYSKESVHMAYKTAFKLYPHGEVARKIYQSFSKEDPGIVKSFLYMADSKLPKNHLVESFIGMMYSELFTDKQLAKKYYKASILHAVTSNQKQRVAMDYAHNYLEGLMFDYDTALLVYQKHLKITATNYLYLFMYLNRMVARDYVSALSFLEKALHLTNLINPQRGIVLKAELRRFIENDKKVDAFNRDNPFLSAWENEFGESLKINIKFATGSNVIPKSDFKKLKTIAKVLKRPGADKYIFSVDGHTDNVGSNAVNIPLSKSRAQSVVKHLNDYHGIAFSKIQSKGYGSRYPVAPNNTILNKSKNRRVEILPLGNIQHPNISLTTQINSTSVALSGDGRHLVTGSYPMQLWDARKGIVIRNLGRGEINKFSPNGRYVASVSTHRMAGGELSRMLYVYDVKKGLAIIQQRLDSSSRSFDWSPDSKLITYTTAKGRLYLYDVKKGKNIKSIRIGDLQKSGVVLWSNDGQFIYTAQEHSDEVRIWKSNSLKLINKLPGVLDVTALGQSHDGLYLYAADRNMKFHKWDIKNWNKSSIGISVYPSQISSHPTKYEVILNNFLCDSQKICWSEVLNTKSNKNIFTFRSLNNQLVSYSPDGSKIYAATGKNISILNSSSYNADSGFRGETEQARFSYADKRNGLYVTFDDKTHVWNIKTGRKIHTWNKKITMVASKSEGSSEFYGVSGKELSLYNLDNMSSKKLFKTINIPNKIKVVNNQLVSAGSKSYIGEDISQSGFIETYSLITNKLTNEFKVDLVTDRLKYKIHNGGFEDISVTKDARYILLSTYWQDGFSSGTTYSKHVRIYDLKTGRKIRTIGLKNPAKKIRLSDDNSDEFDLVTSRATHTYDFNGNKVETNPLEFQGLETIQLISRNSEISYMPSAIIYNDKTTNKITTINFPDNLLNVDIFSKSNLMVSLTTDNKIGLYDLDTITKQLTIVNKKNNEWIAYTPTGEFASSTNGTSRVFWTLGDNYLPFKALRNKFENPKIIIERLAAIAANKPITSTNQIPPSSIDADLFAIPYRIDLQTNTHIKTTSNTYVMKLKITKQKGLAEPVIEYSQNGRIIPKQRALKRKKKAINVDQMIFEESFSLDEGLNIIQASLVYKGARLNPQTVTIVKNSKQQLTASGNKNQLWFLGLGVSDYNNKSYNLDYAHEDAKSIADLLKTQEGNLYSKVNTKVLLNSDVNQKKIKIAMYKFLKQASSQDTIIIFIAGHGTQSNDQTLYYMTHDSDLNEPYTGMEVSQFQDFLLKRPTNQKAIFLMDICHSGAIGDGKINRRGPRLTSEDAVKLLTDGTGVTVMSSSTGRESSLEGKEFGNGHGAFTASLLEGLNGKADKDAGNRDGYVSILELQTYVARRVPKMTHGKQHPTTPLVRKLRDYPISSAN